MKKIKNEKNDKKMNKISNFDVKEKQKKIEKNIKEIIDILELKQTDSIKETPLRVAKMILNDICVGCDKNKFPTYKMFKIDKKYNEPIIVDNISIYSICEHHFLPFIGKAKFSYIPKDKIIGLSKIPRIIDYLSRKPQLQETLTVEIFETFKKILNTENISVELTCEHFCAKMRGIKDDCFMTTYKKGGFFKK